jgi:hypothetical protein
MTSASANGSNALYLEALGSRFVVTCGSAGEAAAIQQQWSRLGAGGSGPQPDMAIDLRSMPAEQQGRALLSHLTVRAIEAAAGDRLMLHAAGVADADGRVLALVGPSGMGKTTASVYLSRHGFGYVTDETVSIGPDADVLPFGRPLSLRRARAEVQISPDELGLGRPPADLRIARIVLLDRVPGHPDPPTLATVPLVDALLELIPQTSAVAKLRQPLQYMSRVIDRCGPVLRLTYGEMDERVRLLLSESLSHETSARERWHAVPSRRRGPSELDPEGSSRVNGRELFQGDIADGIASQRDMLLLVDQVPVRLGEIGLAIWRAARNGVAQTEIMSIVEQQHGAHPEGLRIVREAVDQMLEAGLLVTASDELAVISAPSR